MQPQTNPQQDSPPPSPPSPTTEPQSSPPDLMVPTHPTVTLSVISTEIPPQTPEAIRAKALVNLLEATDLAQAAMRNLLGGDAPPEELMSALFPGWRPPMVRPTDVWLLARVELFIDGKFVPVCAVQQALPAILRQSMVAHAAVSMQTAIDQTIKNPVLAEFLEHVKTDKDGNHPALRS